MKRPHAPTPRPVTGKVRRCPIPGCQWQGRNRTQHLETKHGAPPVRVEDPEPCDEFTGPWGPMRRSDA